MDNNSAIILIIIDNSSFILLYKTEKYSDFSISYIITGYQWYFSFSTNIELI
jgi:hypothetical protein